MVTNILEIPEGNAHTAELSDICWSYNSLINNSSLMFFMGLRVQFLLS